MHRSKGYNAINQIQLSIERQFIEDELVTSHEINERQIHLEQNSIKEIKIK